MSNIMRKYDRFQYFVEDCECMYCLFNTQKYAYFENVCEEETCPFEVIRLDAIMNRRIKRKRGWNRCRHR